jgi:hypothetical protein
VLRRKPLLSFGIAAAIGAIAGLIVRMRPEFLFERPKPGLLSRLKPR